MPRGLVVTPLLHGRRGTEFSTSACLIQHPLRDFTGLVNHDGPALLSSHSQTGGMPTTSARVRSLQNQRAYHQRQQRVSHLHGATMDVDTEAITDALTSTLCFAATSALGYVSPTTPSTSHSQPFT